MTPEETAAASRAAGRWRRLGAAAMVAGLVAVGCSDDGDNAEDNAAPRSAAPAQDGSYPYVVTKTRTTEGSDPGKSRTRVTTRIRTGSRANGDVRQTVTTGKDKAEIAWRSDGQYVLSDNHRELPEQCSWNPPLLAYRLPLETGASWTVDSTCTSGPITVHHTEKARVTGKQRVKVGGVDVDARVVERTSRTNYATAERRIELDNVVTDLFSARYGLVVRSTVKNTTTTPTGQVLTTTTQHELQRVPPR